MKIRVKILNSDSTEDTIGDKLDETPDILGRDVDRDLNMTLADLLPRVLMGLKETNRENDFVSVIKCLASGKLSMNNIALSLLLDLGQYLNQQSSTQMRYSQTSLDFWVVVQKLFKCKGVRFFTGCKTHAVKRIKSEYSEDDIETPLINFVVPSKKILTRECEKYVEKPGVFELETHSISTAQPLS